MPTPSEHDCSSDSQTQQTTQSTQQASQLTAPGQLDAHLWGYLQPCSTKLTRIDFWKIQISYTIGRNDANGVNDVVLPGFKVSEYHPPNQTPFLHAYIRVTR